MKIYVNDQYEILSLDIEPSYYRESFEVEASRQEMFGNLCNTCIRGYKYEPQYEFLFNEDGSNARDEVTGELLYKLDDNGEKNFQGYQSYPFVDYQILTMLQKQHDENQKVTQENLKLITESLVDLDSRQTAIELGLTI